MSLKGFSFFLSPFSSLFPFLFFFLSLVLSSLLLSLSLSIPVCLSERWILMYPKLFLNSHCCWGWHWILALPASAPPPQCWVTITTPGWHIPLRSTGYFAHTIHWVQVDGVFGSCGFCPLWLFCLFLLLLFVLGLIIWGGVWLLAQAILELAMSIRLPLNLQFSYLYLLRAEIYKYKLPHLALFLLFCTEKKILL